MGSFKNRFGSASSLALNPAFKGFAADFIGAFEHAGLKVARRQNAQVVGIV